MKIDKIKIIRGELPQAIEDLEDEIAGLETRIQNFNSEIEATNQKMAAEKSEIAEHNEMTKKYQKQLFQQKPHLLLQRTEKQNREVL